MFTRLRAAVPALGLTAAAVLAFAPAASAVSAPPDYTVMEAFHSGVFRIDNGTGNLSGPSLPGQSWDTDVAMSPDGTTAYVVEDDSVVPVDVATGVAGTPIAVPGAASAIAVSPDGRSAFVGVGTAVRRVRLPGGAVSAPISLGAQVVKSIVYSPDGATAYVLAEDPRRDPNVAQSPTSYITPIDVATGATGTPIAVGFSYGTLRISPDGKTAYVASVEQPIVYGYDLVTGQVTQQVSTGTGTDVPYNFNLSPDGKTMYLATYDGDDTTLTTLFTVDIASGSVGRRIGLGAYWSVADMAVTPDGQTLYVSHSHANQLPNDPAEVLKIDISTPYGDVTPIVTDPSVNAYSGGSLAITADQAPVAALTVTKACAGTASTFDARTSRVRYGSIVKYVWDFGDGVTQTTTTPVTTHVYTGIGAYAASVTETDSAGTSTTVVSSGSAVVLNGGKSARASKAFTIAGCAVRGHA